jgi:chemotaxis regulatin CheY-phosphate phosphatase CheZ
MADAQKPEINLEINTGFLRIPTEKVIYNITVLGSPENSVGKVVDKIVQEEKRAEGTPVVEKEIMQPLPADSDGDDFYKDISQELYNEIGSLAKKLSVTMQDIPAEDRKLDRVGLEDAGERIEHAKSQLKDILTMTENATMEIMDQVEKVQGEADEMKNILSALKEHGALQAVVDDGKTDEVPAAEKGAESKRKLDDSVSELQGILEKARTIISKMQEESVTATLMKEEAPPAGEKTKPSQPFAIDAILQTVYELCTNETVKAHIATSRKNVETLFQLDTFDATLKEKIASLIPGDDNFIEVPVSDVLGSLIAACKDDKIQNLLKRMDATQSEIFSIPTLPLEVPVSASQTAPTADKENIISDTRNPDPRVFELAKLMEGCLALVEEFSEVARLDTGASEAEKNQKLSRDQQKEISDTIENAFSVALSISGEVTRIMELLSFQDLSGQQIMKIIKLLGDFQVQLMAIVLSFGTRLKTKEKNAEITAQESKTFVQDDVDSYFAKLGDEEDKESGMLDQNAVNSLLEDLGF